MATGLGTVAISCVLRVYHQKNADVRWNETEKTSDLGLSRLDMEATGTWANQLPTLKPTLRGHLGGSVGGASDFGSGHDLTVHEFEHGIRLSGVSSEPTSDPLSPPPSAPPSLTVSLKNKHLKKKIYTWYLLSTNW